MICPTATSSRVWGRAIRIFTNDLAGFIRRGLPSICLMMSLLCSLIRLSDFIRRSDLRSDNGLWLSLYLPVLFYYKSFINFEIVASFNFNYFSCFIQSTQHVEMYHFSRHSIILVGSSLFCLDKLTSNACNSNFYNVELSFQVLINK